MSDMDQLIEQNRTQEIEILRLRLRVAQSEKRAADLQRLYDNAQRHIGRLQVQLNPRNAADAVFGGNK